MKEKWSDRKVIIARFAIATSLAAIYIVFAHTASSGLDITHTCIAVDGLPNELDGLRIAQVSDLHSSWFGENQQGLVDAIREFRPDLIAVTGDFVDGYRPDIAPCAELVRGLAPVAPVYVVMGNHEYYFGGDMLAAYKKSMEESGAVFLVNRAVALERNGRSFLLAGMDDMARFAVGPGIVERERAAMEAAAGFMEEIGEDSPEGDFPLKVMLCHEPHYWLAWWDGGYDVALCGHLHGWLFRMPGIGGALRLPSVYFPEEGAGLYEKGGMRVYISRGLDSRDVLRNVRLNNRPELALIEIIKE